MSSASPEPSTAQLGAGIELGAGGRRGGECEAKAAYLYADVVYLAELQKKIQRAFALVAGGTWHVALLGA
jgi:hypothetical protein